MILRTAKPIVDQVTFQPFTRLTLDINPSTIQELALLEGAEADFWALVWGRQLFEMFQQLEQAHPWKG